MARLSPPTLSSRAGARVGLITTRGYRQVLQIARSYVPGGLAGWIIWHKPSRWLRSTTPSRPSSGSRPRQRGRPPWTKTTSGPAAHPRAARRPGDDGLADQLLRQRITRAADRGDRGGGTARRPALGVLRGAARDARVRAHPHHRRELLRAAEGRPLHRQPGGRADDAAPRPACTSCAPTAAWPPRRRGRQPGLDADVRPGGRRRRRDLGRRQAGYRDFLTFDMGGTSTDVALVQAGCRASAGKPGRRRDGAGHLARRADHRRGRRLDRARPGADPGAAGRPAVGRRRARPGRVPDGRRRADRDRRQRGARLPAGRTGRR